METDRKLDLAELCGCATEYSVLHEEYLIRVLFTDLYWLESQFDPENNLEQALALLTSSAYGRDVAMIYNKWDEKWECWQHTTSGQLGRLLTRADSLATAITRFLESKLC